MRPYKNHTVTIQRATVAGSPGWWYEAADSRGTVRYSGWTAGLGPLAKSQAMKDACEAIDRGPLPVDARITDEDRALAEAALAAPTRSV